MAVGPGVTDFDSLERVLDLAQHAVISLAWVVDGTTTFSEGDLAGVGGVIKGLLGLGLYACEYKR